VVHLSNTITRKDQRTFGLLRYIFQILWNQCLSCSNLFCHGLSCTVAGLLGWIRSWILLRRHCLMLWSKSTCLRQCWSALYQGAILYTGQVTDDIGHSIEPFLLDWWLTDCDVLKNMKVWLYLRIGVSVFFVEVYSNIEGLLLKNNLKRLKMEWSLWWRSWKELMKQWSWM